MNRRVVIAVGIIVAGLLGLIIFTLARKPGVNPPHKTEYEGFSQLLSRGATDFQVTAAETAVSAYLSKSQQTVDTVELAPNSVEIVPRSRLSEANDMVMFRLLFDNQPNDAQLEYIGLKSIRLRIYDDSGKTIFDSGRVSPEIETEHTD